MKFYYKYILLLFLLCYFSNDVAAKKRSKKPTRSAQQIKKAANKKGKTKQGKKKKANRKTKQSTKPATAPKTVKLETLSQTVIAPIVSNNAEQVPEKTITIISAFKPQLKNVAKMDFGNATFSVDTSSISLNYQVPSQKLTFQYKPISLVPRAIRIVYPVQAKNSGLLKLGYGNYFQSLVDVNYSVIDNKNNTHSILGNYEAFQGLHHLQKENKFAIGYLADYTLDSLNHLQTELFYEHHNRYRYGQVPDSSNLPIANFLQKSSKIGARISWLNFNTANKLVTLKPTLAFDHFLGVSKATNTTLEFINPMYFRVNNAVRINFDIAYSYSTYKSPAVAKKSNDILRFDPSIQTDIWGTNILLGASPTFDNGVYNMNPNVLVKKKLKDTNYLIIAGWNTNYKLNKYKDLALYNPWIEAPTDLKNTIIEKKFIELIINASKKLDYSIGFAFNDYKQMPFFNKMEFPLDKSSIGLLYETLFEQRAKTLELFAKARYQMSYKLLLTGKLNYTQFNSIRINSKPWGITPLNIETSLKWDATEKLSIDANAKYWSGASFSNETNGFHTLNNAFVLNAGFNYKVSSKWNAWVKGNNFLDKPYERWADYPSLGVQLMVGIVYSFR